MCESHISLAKEYSKNFSFLAVYAIDSKFVKKGSRKLEYLSDWNI